MLKARSPEAQRNPAKPFPRSASLHPGYKFLRAAAQVIEVKQNKKRIPGALPRPYHPPRPVQLRASSRGVSMMEPDVAPAGEGKRILQSRAARGTRKPVYAVCANANRYAGGTKTSRQELADSVSLRDLAESAARADKTLRWSAAGRASFRQRTHALPPEARTKDGCATRRSISLSLFGEGRVIRGDPVPGKEYGRRSVG